MLLLLKERNDTDQAGVVAQLRGADLDFAPGRPCVARDVILQKGNDDVGALHDAATVDQHIRIEGVDRGDGRGGPDAQAVIENLAGYGVAVVGAGEEIFEIDFFLSEGARGEVRPLRANEGEGPSGGFRFRATESAAGAEAAMKGDGHVSAEHAGLAVLALEQCAVHHGDTADAGAECEHHHVGFALSRAGIPFAEKGEARIVFETQREAELAVRPLAQVEAGSIDELAVGRTHAAVARIHLTAKAETEAVEGHAIVRDQFAEERSDLGEQGREGPGVLEVHGAPVQNGAIFHQRAGGVRARRFVFFYDMLL